MRSIALILILILSFPSFANAGVIEGIVVNVADGDTLTVLDTDKEKHRVRIAGIDVPEKGQAFGNAPRKRLGGLVARKEVAVEFRKHDRIYAREQSLEDLGRYEFAEEEAKARGAGLWRDANPTPPWDFRRGIRWHGRKKRIEGTRTEPPNPRPTPRDAMCGWYASIPMYFTG